jgi:hypothetical protein
MGIKKILTNKVFLVITLIVFVTSVILGLYDVEFNYVMKRMNSKACEEEALIKSIPIKGAVVEKFEDKRKLNFFKYSDGKQTYTSYLGLVSNDFYDYIEVGDSLNKNINSLELKVWNAEKDTIYSIDFGCNDKL